MTETLLIVAVVLLVVIVASQVALLFRKVHIELTLPQGLQPAEQLGERLENALRDEIGKNRAEAATAASQSRVELQNTLRAFADTLAALTQASLSNAKTSREEIAAALKSSNELLVNSIGEIATLQKGQLDLLAERLTRANDQMLGKMLETIEQRLGAIQEGSRKDSEQARDTLLACAKTLQEQIATTLKGFNESLINSLGEMANLQKEQLDVISGRVDKLTEANDQTLGSVCETVEKQLGALQDSNTAALDEIRKETTAAQKMREDVSRIVTDFGTLQQRQFSSVMEQLRTLTGSNEKQWREIRGWLEAKLKSLQEGTAAKVGETQQPVVEAQEPAENTAIRRRERTIRAWAEKQLGGKVHVDEDHPERPIVRVDLPNTKVTNAELAQHLKDLPDLQSLDLSSTKVTDVGLALKGSISLTELDLGESQVTDADLEYIKGLPRLEKLFLWSTRISDVGVKCLEGLTNLRWLDLARTEVTDCGLSHLTHLTNLETLDLGDTAVTDLGLAALKALPKLRTLDVMNTQVTDCGVDHITTLLTLHTLVLSGTQVTDTGMGCLKRLVNLHRLHLGRTQITDTGMAYLKETVRLQSLRVQNTIVTDTGLSHIAGLTRLQSLILTGTQVSDSGIAHLKDMRGLQSLSVRNTQVGDAGIAHLTVLLRLQSLDVQGTKVSDDGIKIIQRALPNCLIRHSEFPSRRQVAAPTKAHAHRAEVKQDRPTVNDEQHVAKPQKQSGRAAMTTANQERENKIRDWAEELGGKVHVDEEHPEWGVVGVDLPNSAVTDTDIKHLKEFPELRWVTLGDNTQVTDAELANLKELPNLHLIQPVEGRSSDAGRRVIIIRGALASGKGKVIKGPFLRFANASSQCKTSTSDLYWLVRVETNGLYIHFAEHEIEFMDECGPTEMIPAELGVCQDQQLMDSTANQERENSLQDSAEDGLAGAVIVDEHHPVVGVDLANTNDASLEHCKEAPELQSVKADITKDILRALRKGVACLTQLERSQLTDAHLEGIKGWTTITRLDLRDTQISDAGLTNLVGLRYLTSLDLGNTDVTDRGLAHIKELPNLRELILTNTRVTVHALEHIKRLRNLLTLDVTGTQVRTTTKAFRTALPNCLVSPFRDERHLSYQAKDARRQGFKIASAIVKEQKAKAHLLEAKIGRHKAVDAQGAGWLKNRRIEHPSLNWTLDTVKLLVDAGRLSLDSLPDWTIDKFKVLAKDLGIPLSSVFDSRKVSAAIERNLK